MEPHEIIQVREGYEKAASRLIILDLDCLAVLDRLHLGEEANRFVNQVTSDEGNEVIILSSKTREELRDLFVELPLTLVSENGGFSRKAHGAWQVCTSSSVLWREPVIRALRSLAQQYPGSFTEEKYFSVAWHFDAAEVSITAEDKKQLFTGLRALAKQFDLVFKERDHLAEFTIPGVGKEKFVTEWMNSHGHYDVILAVGDNSDERLFALLAGYFTICVGYSGPTGARFEIRRRDDMLSVLNMLIIS